MTPDQFWIAACELSDDVISQDRLLPAVDVLETIAGYQPDDCDENIYRLAAMTLRGTALLKAGLYDEWLALVKEANRCPCCGEEIAPPADDFLPPFSNN